MKYIYLGLSYLFCLFTHAQINNSSSSDIYTSIQQLKNIHQVLYVAAHPDDENTHLISYFANHLNINTAYISLTRGDGGQNLIGPELKDDLGVIRTHELLEARKIDGAQQFFSRAKDYGFSKNPDETFSQWEKERVLYDLIFTIRKFQPDIVVNRFAHNTPGTTHGHHTASAILSYEAFEKAADPEVFPEQISQHGLSPWQVKKLFFNDSWFFYNNVDEFENADRENFIEIDIGQYYPLKGVSNGELASVSRSQHKSQGFGSLLNRGTKMEYLQQIKGMASANNDIFSNLPSSWSALTSSKKIDKKLKSIIKKFDFENPHYSIEDLIELKQLFASINDEKIRSLVNQKIETIDQLIYQCAGLHIELLSQQAFQSPGNSVQLKLNALVPNTTEIKLFNLKTPFQNKLNQLQKKLPENEILSIELAEVIPNNYPYSNPFWLNIPTKDNFFEIEEEEKLLKAIDLSSTMAELQLEIEGEIIQINLPIEFKYNHPVNGENKDHFFVTPKVSLTNKNKVQVFTNEEWRSFEVDIKSYTENLSGQLHLELEGWNIEPSFYEIEQLQLNEEQSFSFKIQPKSDAISAKIQPYFIDENGEKHNLKVGFLAYEHFPTRQLVAESTSQLIKIDAQTKGEKVAYLPGAGDEIAKAMKELGYEVEELKIEDLGQIDLSNFQGVVLGIRAFNVHDELAYKNKYLYDYVENGGNLIVFYNTSRGLKTQQIAPKKLVLDRGRVTDEKAKINFLKPEHALLQKPNKITETDFENWVQERGLYFAKDWDEDFQNLFSLNDPDEDLQEGSLLYLPYGKGNYIYTGLSFFRQLPVGVEGAYRLLANLISIENEIE